MRLVWRPAALRNLAVLAERAPVQAQRVIAAAVALAQSGFPDQGKATGVGRQRWHTVAPHGIIYRIDGENLVIIRIADSRRRTKPW